VGFGRLLPLHKPSPFGDKAMIQKLMVPVRVKVVVASFMQPAAV